MIYLKKLMLFKKNKIYIYLIIILTLFFSCSEKKKLNKIENNSINKLSNDNKIIRSFDKIKSH